MIQIHMLGTLEADKILKRIEKTPDRIKKGVRRALYESGKELHAEAIALINKKPKHGRVYGVSKGIKGKKLKRIKRHVASAPGEAPAVITGKLRKSVGFQVNGYTQMTFFSRGAEYAPFLEYKDIINMTGWGSKNIAPRPYISGAYAKYKFDIEKRLINAVKGSK